MQLLTRKQYLKLVCFEMPKESFVYSPLRPNNFAEQGETMVKALLATAPSFAARFDKLIAPELQQEVAERNFLRLKEDWNKYKQTQSFNLKLLTESTSSKKYFEQNRKFGRLTPVKYYRSQAPRMTTSGSTFHGMKKVLQLSILQDLTRQNENLVFVDFDMSAAHTRIARFLLSQEDSQLTKVLKDPEFWKTQIADVKPLLPSNVVLEDKIIKKILKVGLYTSLNGGNPVSTDRLVDNLTLNADTYLKTSGIQSLSDLKADPLFAAVEAMLQKFTLIDEVKQINAACVDDTTEELNTYTIDRTKPYVVSSKHLGISRILQGFEVVLLTVLVRDLVAANAIPVSLDHDGTLVVLPKSFITSTKDPSQLVKSLFVDNIFRLWSNYLLYEELPIEVKRIICAGEVYEF